MAIIKQNCWEYLKCGRGPKGSKAKRLGVCPAAREKRLRDNLAQLVQEKRRTIERDVPDDAARAAGADIRWHRWVDERRAIINIELAQVLSEKLECQRSLARAFGRDQAVATLLDKQQKTEAKQQQKREI